MSEEFLETDREMVSGHTETSSYQEYLDLGGIINENDYKSALSRIKGIEAISKTQISQVNGMLDFAGIELDGDGAANLLVGLYSILRSDVRPKGAEPHQEKIVGGRPTSGYHDGISSYTSKQVSKQVEHHHDLMYDQQILVEALRMLGDAKSVDKMIATYPNISFAYERAEIK